MRAGRATLAIAWATGLAAPPVRADDAPPAVVRLAPIVRPATPPLSPAPTPTVDPGRDARSRAGRDPVTGAATGAFGGAYAVSSPLPSYDPGRRDPDLPDWWTGQR